MTRNPVLTVGHSTRTADELTAILSEAGVTLLADVRTVPRSRHNPQFNADVLPETLERRGIRYVHLPELGGLRRPQHDSPNRGWRNDSFRGYADYMLTPEFTDAVSQLMTLSRENKVAIMCAEAVPWRCHRSLIGDALTVRGIAVLHLMGIGKISPHQVTRWARVEGETITYPPEGESP